MNYSGSNTPEWSGCDPEKVFELADFGGVDPEQEQRVWEHLSSCPDCRELYERELALNAYLRSFDFSTVCSSVSRGVAMALPTRSPGVRAFWGLLAFALLVVSLVFLKLNGTEPVILLIGTLGAGWGFVAGLAKVAHTVLATAGPSILLLLALGALADLLIAFVVLSVSRSRRAREA